MHARGNPRAGISRISRGENLGLSVSIGDAAVHAASLLLVKQFFSRRATSRNLRSLKLRRAAFLWVVKHLSDVRRVSSSRNDPPRIKFIIIIMQFLMQSFRNDYSHNLATSPIVQRYTVH